MKVLEIGSRSLYNRRSVSLNETGLLVHLSAAVSWLVHAHEKAGDGGISKGYDLLRGKWASSYPETTGYTIPTLINVAKKTKESQLILFIKQLGEYLLSQADDTGGVVHWNSRKYGTPVVFDTGQVVFGWLACWQVFEEARFLHAAIKAGDWLLSIQSPDGVWKRNQHLGVEKVIDSRVSWALLELSKHTKREKYQAAARSNLDWVLTQQSKNGWFNKCSFHKDDYPITHTLAYTAEGLLECGIGLDDQRYIDAAKLTADAFLLLQRNNGSLAGAFDQNWRAKSLSSCLTGNCQIANLWLRLHSITGRKDYLNAAIKAIEFVAGVQDVTTRNSDICGAIPGSYPIYGSYERLKYPNWAAKFFIDSVLLIDSIHSKDRENYYPG